MQTNWEKVQIFSQTWQVFTGFFVSLTWLQNCKKKKKFSPKIWSVKIQDLWKGNVLHQRSSAFTLVINRCCAELRGVAFDSHTLSTWTYAHHFYRFNFVLPTSLVIFLLFYTHYLSFSYLYLFISSDMLAFQSSSSSSSCGFFRLPNTSCGIGCFCTGRSGRKWVKMLEVDGSEMNGMTGTGFLSPEDGTNRLSWNIGKKLPPLAV